MNMVPSNNQQVLTPSSQQTPTQLTFRNSFSIKKAVIAVKEKSKDKEIK